MFEIIISNTEPFFNKLATLITVFSEVILFNETQKQLFTLLTRIAPITVGYPGGQEHRHPGSHQDNAVKERLIDCESTKGN